MEALGSAVQSGELSFSFFDASYWDRFGGLAANGGTPGETAPPLGGSRAGGPL